MTQRDRVESQQKGQEDETFEESEEENQKELRWDALQIEPAFEELGQIKEKGSRKGVEAEIISGKEIHEISQEES